MFTSHNLYAKITCAPIDVNLNLRKQAPPGANPKEMAKKWIEEFEAREEQHAQCETCKSEGELSEH